MYLIGKLFTRLMPAIDFSSASATSTDDTACVLGTPPNGLACVHLPQLVNLWQRNLVGALATPAVTENRSGKRRVQVLGTAIFEFDGNGSVAAYLWSFDTQGLLALERLKSSTVIVKNVPHKEFWARGFKDAGLRILQSQFPGHLDVCLQYAEWVHQALLARHWTPMVQEAVRENVQAALQFNEEVRSVAEQIQPLGEARLPVRLDAYNHVLRRRRLLELESPNLVTLYGQLADAVSVTGEVTKLMRTYLVAHGVKPAMWRLLCRSGTDWLKNLEGFFDLSRTTRSAATAELLKVAQEFGTQQLMPTWMLHAILQIGGNPNAKNASYIRRIDDLFGLCARLGTLAARADTPALMALQEHTQDIFNWASSYLRLEAVNFVQRVTVVGLLRAVKARQRLERAQRSGQRKWLLPYVLKSPIPGCEVVILKSPLAVWQEGEDMRHCADNYIDECSRKVWVMASIRSTQRTRPLATVAFNLGSPVVKIAHMSGFANSLVEPWVADIAQQCASQLQTQRERRLAAKVGRKTVTGGSVWLAGIVSNAAPAPEKSA